MKRAGYLTCVGLALFSLTVVADERDLEIMTAFATNSAAQIRPMVSAGEAMALYGRGYSDAASARDTICAYRVFRTLADAGTPVSPHASELAAAFAEAIRCTTRKRASAPCFDFGFWGPLGRFGFDEPLPELLIWDAAVADDLRFEPPEFFPPIPLAGYSAAERAYAASCRYRGCPYRAPGADIREGGRVPLCAARKTGRSWMDRGAFKSDYTFSEPCRMRRQLVVRPLGDGVTAVVRERVQMLGDGDLYDGYDALPFAANCVRVLVAKGRGLKADERLFAQYGETLYDVTYVVNAKGDAAALATASPAVLKLPVITEPGDETSYWQSKIDALSASGGGTVTVSPGAHKVCELELKSNVTLEIPEGATILAVTNAAAYCWELGVKAELQKTGVIVAYGATNIALVGKGVIDGRGDEMPRGNPQAQGRWRNVFLYRCRGVRMEGLTIRRPNFWTVFLRECDDVRVKGLTIRSYANWNNDGLDLCVAHALVEDCDIISEDDGIVFKSFDPDWVSQDVEIRNCRVSSNAGAIKFGTETFGIFRDYDIHDCEILSRHKGVKTLVGSESLPGVTDPRAGSSALSFLMVDGGVLERICVHDIDIGAAYASPLCFRLGHRHGRENWGRTAMRDILFERIRMTAPAESWCGSYACGVPGSIIDGITIRDSRFLVKAAPESASCRQDALPNVDGRYPAPGMFGVPMPAHFLFCRYARNTVLQNVEVKVVGGAERRPQFVEEK